jgi:hypothetical protein
MTRDSGVMRQHPNYPQAIQELLDQFHQRQQTPKLATNPDELERAFDSGGEPLEVSAFSVKRRNFGR